MNGYEHLCIVQGRIAAGAVVLISLRSSVRLWEASSAKRTGAVALGDVYRDKDGAATEESEALYRAKSPRFILYAVSILGFAASVTSGVLSLVLLSSLFPQRYLVTIYWQNVFVWFLLTVQAISISVERSPVARYLTSLCGAASAFILLFVLVIQNSLILQRMRSSGILETSESFLKIQLGLGAAQIGMAAKFFSFCLATPRRPDIFTGDGKSVDGQFSVSAYRRLTFTWCQSFLEMASRKPLNLEDLPCPAHIDRSRSLKEAFRPLKTDESLLKLLLFAHWGTLVYQLALVIVQSGLSFAPQFAMLQVLRHLELQPGEHKEAFQTWIWVFLLGLGIAIPAWLRSYTSWVSTSTLTLRVRAQLSALIFDKAMRRKDVREAGKMTAKSGPTFETAPAAEVNSSSKSSGKKTTPTKTLDQNEKKSTQSTVNLISIDSARVSNFGNFIRFYPDILIRTPIAWFFLVSLIGWTPLLAGILGFLVITPLNTLIFIRITAMQRTFMKVRDQKTAILTEALRGMRQIKFAAVENLWQEKIGKVRSEELKLQWQRCLLQTGLIFGWSAGPLLLSTVSLSVYSYLEGGLKPSIAFTTIGVFGAAEGIFTLLPLLTIFWTETKISLDRIEKFLKAAENTKNVESADEISFENVSLSWPSDSDENDDSGRFVLRDINVAFPSGELSVISGATGSGKSLMLSSIIGECDILSGVARVPKALPFLERHDNRATADNWILLSAIAFVSQIPWIENATLKDNILFGLPFDALRYKKTLSACALEKDLDMLVDGDMTEIGANGINLSGGQRWRVSLARAIYSRAGILVLDDIFSAVDTHVGRWIFENALTGELGQGRTRILATHHASLCISKTAYAVQLGDGTIKHVGHVEELKKTGVLVELLETGSTPQNVVEEEIKQVEDVGAQKYQNLALGAGDPAKPKKFVEDEHREVGGIKTKVYIEYFRVSGGLIFWMIALVIFIVSQCTGFGRSWWIKVWTSSYDELSTLSWSHDSAYRHHSSVVLSTAGPSLAIYDNDLVYYLAVYFVLGIAQVLLAMIRNLYVFSLAIRGSRTLFNAMLSSILRTPLRWIDTVPIGRILNRFSADFSTIDSSLANNMTFLIDGMFHLVMILAASLFASPIVIIFGLILLGTALHFARYYLAGARDAKRLEAVCPSPILEQLGSALVGVGTIRAFGNTEAYTSKMYSRLDDYTTTSWYRSLSSTWLSFRLSMIGVVFTFAVAALVVGTKSADAALAGFTISFALQFSGTISRFLQTYTSCELDMNAAERVQEYVHLKTESQDGMDVPAAWPTEGRLTVQDLVVSYAEDLPAVLNGLSFSVEKNERVGIVGRTGAGKSSLALALFRFLEAREGIITIDDLDISKLKLFDLRSRLAIIPQDPTIFSGTIRSNLDSFDESTDDELRDALQKVHLIPSGEQQQDPQISASENSSTNNTNNTNVNIFNDLSSEISDGGLNLSQGQRQLLCLARAIVRRSKIMVLDEATSAVDMETDVLIQRSIRADLGGSTLLVIAHRLSTVADFDRILVMSDGRAVEFGSPRELWEKKGMFYDMAMQSGDVELLEQMILKS